MRIVRLFPFACAAFMMSACASENDDKGGDTNAEGKAQYMAVNIVSVGTNGSRAAAEYENGLEKESQIKKVRFYFYNQDGSPYILDGKKQTGLNLMMLSKMASKIPMVKILHRKLTLFLFSNQKLATLLLILLLLL